MTKRRPLQLLPCSHMQQLLAAVLLETPCDSNPQRLRDSSNWVSSSLSISATASNHVESSRLVAAHDGDSSQYRIMCVMPAHKFDGWMAIGTRYSYLGTYGRSYPCPRRWPETDPAWPGIASARWNGLFFSGVPRSLQLGPLIFLRLRPHSSIW